MTPTISLINPPQSRLREPKSYIPLGLAYIGASLLNNNFDVNVENLADVNREIKFKNNHSNIFLITYPSASVEGVKKTINYIRKKYPKSKIVIGGPHPSVEPLNTFNEIDSDIIMTGEVEESIVSLLTQPNSMDIKKVVNSGIIKNLDSLQFPARQLFNTDDVVNITGIHGCEKGTKSTTIITSRGCVYKCSFCCRKHPMYSNYRIRSAENVKKEITELKEDYGIEHIRFVDDCFTLNKDRTKKICEYTKDLEVSFMCITRADICDIETLKTLKDGGCTTVDIGVESGSDKLLKLMNKKETSEQMKKCITNAKKIGLKTKVFLQYNLPYERDEDIQKTLNFLRETKPDYYTLSKFIPLSGSNWSNIKTKNNNEWFYDDNDEKRKYLIGEIDNILSQR